MFSKARLVHLLEFELHGGDPSSSSAAPPSSLHHGKQQTPGASSPTPHNELERQGGTTSRHCTPFSIVFPLGLYCLVQCFELLRDITELHPSGTSSNKILARLTHEGDNETLQRVIVGNAILSPLKISYVSL